MKYGDLLNIYINYIYNEEIKVNLHAHSYSVNYKNCFQLHKHANYVYCKKYIYIFRENLFNIKKLTELKNLRKHFLLQSIKNNNIYE